MSLASAQVILAIFALQVLFAGAGLLLWRWEARAAERAPRPRRRILEPSPPDARADDASNGVTVGTQAA